MREQESMEKYKKQKRYLGGLEIEEMKLKMRREYEKEKKQNEKEQSSIRVKLANLMISIFEGTDVN